MRGIAVLATRSSIAFHNVAPSDSDVSYVLKVTILGDQLGGTGIHSVSGKKNGCVRMRQPMTKSLRSVVSARRYFAMRRRISASDTAPLLAPNASHASEQGIEFA